MYSLLSLICLWTISSSGVTALAAESVLPKTRVFILSGQSNMKHVDPEDSFRPALKAAFPNDELIIIKQASSGEPIRRWYKRWRAKGNLDNVGLIGNLAEKLMADVKTALNGKQVPASITFIWMQGEADALKPEMYQVYAESLKGLVAQMRHELNRPDMFVVIGRISDFAENPAGSKAVREAQVSVAEADPLARWVDTDDLNGKSNALHYSKEGYKMLGERFATKSIELIQKPKASQFP